MGKPVSKSIHREIKLYGYELVLDLHDCNTNKFNRSNIESYFTEICRRISMTKCEVHFWDDVGVPEDEKQTSPKTKGTSAVCFILTSSIVIHTLDILKIVYVNIFSCKEFDPDVAAKFSQNWFEAGSYRTNFLSRI